MNQRQMAFLALILLGAGQPSIAAAESGEPVDEITVKGQTLRGTVVSLGSDTLEFETVYGSGRLRIALEDLEDINPLAFRATLVNINDNNPSPDTGNNKFQTIMGVALRF